MSTGFRGVKVTTLLERSRSDTTITHKCMPVHISSMTAKGDPRDGDVSRRVLLARRPFYRGAQVPRKDSHFVGLRPSAL